MAPVDVRLVPDRSHQLGRDCRRDAMAGSARLSCAVLGNQHRPGGDRYYWCGLTIALRAITVSQQPIITVFGTAASVTAIPSESAVSVGPGGQHRLMLRTTR